MSFDPENIMAPGAKIKVIGVGGGGGNAVNTMIRSNLEGVDFITANTDVQALRFSLANARIQVGKELTRGLGAGADPDIGRDAAMEDRHAIEEVLRGADMVFITAGMGGGTGTGGAAVVAQIARELGALTVAVVTKPFSFEGRRRRKHADIGINRLRESVDTLITIPNQRLLQVASPGLSMIDAFKMADDVLVNAVRGISDIINIPGTINVDFADVKAVMSSMGQALMGIGFAEGDGRAVTAARMAISSPLLEDIDIEGATGILINITAPSNVSLMEINEACSIIEQAAHEDAQIIFGAVIDEALGNQIRVTVIATGFPVDKEDTAAGDTFVKPAPRRPIGVEPILRAHAAANPVQAPVPPVIQTEAPIMPITPVANVHIPVTRAPGPVVVPPAPIPEPMVMAPEPEVLIHAEPEAAPVAEQAFSTREEARTLADWTMAAQIDEPTESDFTANFTHLHAIPDLGAPEPTDHDFVETAEAEPLKVEETHWHRPGAVKDESPLFAGHDEFTASDDLDRKIDEALELAERMRAPKKSFEGDDLDVPAFLRSGAKDIPLD